MDLKPTIIALMISAAFCSAALAAPLPSEQDRAAVVNGVLITGREFHVELGRVERKAGSAGQAPDAVKSARLKKSALENLITRELLYQEAMKSGIKVPQADVAAEVGKLRKQFAGEAEFAATLGQMGLSEAAVKGQVEKGMAIQRFIDARFASKVKVTDTEVGYYYEDHQDEFKAAGHKPGTFSPLSEVREKIREKIKQDRVERELSPYLKRLREQAKVVILLDEERTD